jgi:periplasmic protein TonB
MTTVLIVENARYFDDLSRRNWGAWIISALVAGGLNLALFLLMPYLMDPSPKRSSIETLVPQINVIRVKRPETKVVRKPVKPPKPREVKMVKQPAPPSKHPPKIRNRLTLPFEINPRLPSGPTTLDLPPLESGPLTNLTGLPEVFSLGQLDAPLMVLNRIPPVYPMRAKRRGIEGWVKVKLMVDETGSVSRVTILEAEPPDIFEKAVRRSAGKWRFKPGTVGGMPVKTWVETTIKFELE